MSGKDQANATHYRIGQEVREAIRRMGGTMPEDLPTPAKSIQELQREEQKRIEAQRQPSLFDLQDDPGADGADAPEAGQPDRPEPAGQHPRFGAGRGGDHADPQDRGG